MAVASNFRRYILKVLNYLFLSTLFNSVSGFQLSPNCQYLQTTIYFEIGPEKFSCTGKVLQEAGFTEIMPWLALGADEEIPLLKQNTLLSVEEVSQAVCMCIRRR